MDNELEDFLIFDLNDIKNYETFWTPPSSIIFSKQDNKIFLKGLNRYFKNPNGNAIIRVTRTEDGLIADISHIKSNFVIHRSEGLYDNDEDEENEYFEEAKIISNNEKNISLKNELIGYKIIMKNDKSEKIVEDLFKEMKITESPKKRKIDLICA